jgi:hypothetical protein
MNVRRFIWSNDIRTRQPVAPREAEATPPGLFLGTP